MLNSIKYKQLGMWCHYDEFTIYFQLSPQQLRVHRHSLEERSQDSLYTRKHQGLNQSVMNESVFLVDSFKLINHFNSLSTLCTKSFSYFLITAVQRCTVKHVTIPFCGFFWYFFPDRIRLLSLKNKLNELGHVIHE